MQRCFCLLLLGGLLFLPGCKDHYHDAISFETLNKENTGGGFGVAMDILVSETARREEIMHLLEAIRKDYKDRTFVDANVYNSREAWQQKDNKDFSRDAYAKHHVARLRINKMTDVRESLWLVPEKN